MKRTYIILISILTVLGFHNLKAQNLSTDNPGIATRNSENRANWFTDSRLKLLGGEMSADGKYYAYIYVNTANKDIKTLTLTGYDNVLELNITSTVEISEMTLLQSEQETGVKIFSAPIQQSGVYRVKTELKNADSSSEVLNSYYYENGKALEYASDMPYTGKVGYGSIKVDRSPDNLIINLMGQKYAKGMGLHSQSWVIFSVEKGKYARFLCDAGIQKNYTGRADAQLKFNTKVINYFTEVRQDRMVKWDYEIPADVSEVTVDFFMSNYGIGSAHSCIGGARMYLTEYERKPQNIIWNQSQDLYLYRPATIKLNAESTSALPVYYRIVSGNSNAEIVDNSILKINAFTSDIVVEAYQTGDNEWEPAQIKTSVFKIHNGSKVQIGNTVDITTGDELDELIIYGNGIKTGEVNVKGLPKVNNIIYKCKFRPSAWNFISFPSAVNLNEISNLQELGYELNAPQGKAAYYVMEYDTQNRAEKPSSSSWKLLQTPVLEPKKGYIIGINNVLTTDSVEVTFRIDNTSMDVSGSSADFNVTVDLSECEPQSLQTFYVSPVNVKGNTLRMDVEFNPQDYSELPVNHEEALKNARITFAPDYKGIRITLPDATPSKVAIFDRKGKKLIKAVNYISPMMIDISDMKHGEYRVFISYGNAYAEKSFELPERK